MKKLFKEIGIAMGIFVLIAGSIEWRLTGINTPIDNIFVTVNGSKTKSIAIIGNSHTGALLSTTDTDFLNKSINLSLPNLELIDRLKVLQYTLSHSAVSTVVLGLDVDQVGHIVSSNNYDMQMNRYGLPMHYNSIGNRVISNFNSFRLRLNIKDLLINLRRGKVDSIPKINFIPFTSKKKSDMEACEKRAKEHSTYIFQAKLMSENLLALNQIVELCKSKNVKLYLLQTPKTNCYTSSFLNDNMKQATNSIDSLARKNGLVFHNFLGNLSFDDNYFEDFDHLNEKGANKLIDQLKLNDVLGK